MFLFARTDLNFFSFNIYSIYFVLIRPTGYQAIRMVVDGRTLRAIKARCSIYIDNDAPAFRIGERHRERTMGTGGGRGETHRSRNKKNYETRECEGDI